MIKLVLFDFFLHELQHSYICYKEGNLDFVKLHKMLIDEKFDVDSVK